MRCPVCPDTTLSMSNREGIEIDYCPKCRGVWLDRGELDKIIERSGIPDQSAAMPPADPRQQPGGYRHYDDDHRKYHYKKRRGLLGDLFDFD
jgi:uncharacterized protein